MWAFSEPGRHCAKARFWHFGHLAFESFEPLRRYALRKTLEMQRPNDVTTKTDARSLVVKLMDYHIVFAQMIGTSSSEPRSSTSRATRMACARV